MGINGLVEGAVCVGKTCKPCLPPGKALTGPDSGGQQSIHTVTDPVGPVANSGLQGVRRALL